LNQVNFMAEPPAIEGMLRRVRRLGLLAPALLHAAVSSAQIAPEAVGQVATLPAEIGAHWVWASDSVLNRSALFDADSGAMLGMVNGGVGVSPLRPHVSRARGEVYVVETVYSRGHRGERTDLVTLYDATTLGVAGEVVIPPKRADNGNGVALAALLDGDRFLVVFNQNPGMSVSVVDLESRRFTGEIQTGGCALVLPAGPRRFGMLCGDGSALAITLDDAGNEAGRARGPVFFDATQDPLTEKGVRAKDGLWLFASFEGVLFEIDFAADPPRAEAMPLLFADDERREGWRVGGLQHLAYHGGREELYSIVHQGGPGSHKDAGREIWVYQLGKGRVRSIAVENLTVAFLRPLLGLEAGGVADWLLSSVLPNPGADAIAVTQDDAPLLLVGERESGAVGVYDARTGEHLRDLEETGIGGGLLVVP
jgi:methylamine dehydrogenase heavy chain